MNIASLSHVTELNVLRNKLMELIESVDHQPISIRGGYSGQDVDVLKFIDQRAARDAILPLLKSQLRKTEDDLRILGVELPTPLMKAEA